MQLIPISKKDTRAQEAGLAASTAVAAGLTANEVKNARKAGKQKALHQSKLKQADAAYEERYKWRPSDKQKYVKPERKYKAMTDLHDTLKRAHGGMAAVENAKIKDAKILGGATAVTGAALGTAAGVKYARRRKAERKAGITYAQRQKAERRKKKEANTVSVYKSAFGIIHKADGADMVRRRERKNNLIALGTGAAAAGSAGAAASYTAQTKNHARAAYNQGLKTPMATSLQEAAESSAKTGQHLKAASGTGGRAALAGAGALALGGIAAHNLNRNRNIRRNREQNMASEDRLAAKLKNAKVSKGFRTRKTKKMRQDSLAQRAIADVNATKAAQAAQETKHVVPKMSGGKKVALAGGAGLLAAGAGAGGYAHYKKKQGLQ